MRMLTELSKNKSVKLKGKDMMCFDDYQYNNINQFILDMTLNPKKAKKQIKQEGQGSSSSGENSDNELPESDKESEKNDKKKIVGKQVRLFNEEEVLDIEEA